MYTIAQTTCDTHVQITCIPTCVLLLVHESHDVLHQMPSLLRILGGLSLLHHVRYLNFAPWEGREKDTHLLQDGHVLTVTEVQRVDVQTGRSVGLLAGGTDGE